MMLELKIWLHFHYSKIKKIWEPLGIDYPLQYSWVSLVAQMVKNLPAMRETWVWSLGCEDPLEESMANHSSILAWRISWTEEPDRLQSMGLQRAGQDWATNTFSFHFLKKKEKTLIIFQNNCQVTIKAILHKWQGMLTDLSSQDGFPLPPYLFQDLICGIPYIS